MNAKKNAFVIMPFSSTDRCTEGEWTEIYEDVFKPAIEASGYTCERALPTTGNLIASIIESLKSSWIVLADLTDKNPNVFYELGVRHSLSKRTIIVCQNMDDIPSDLKSYWFLKYGKTKKERKIFKSDIKRVISNIEAAPEKSDSPVLDFLEREHKSFSSSIQIENKNLGNVQPNTPEERSSEPISLLSEEQFMQHIQQALHDTNKEGFFCFLGKTWVFPLFLTTVMARIRKVRITVLYDSSDIHERYNLLNLIGCRMVPCTLPRPTFTCALFDPDEPTRGLMYTYSIKQKDGVFARRHACPHDYHSILPAKTLVNALVKDAGGPPAEHATFTPEILSVKPKDLVKLIQQGRYYRDASITVEDIEIENTKPIARIVETNKVNQARMIIKFYKQKKWPLFAPASVRLANGKESFIIPPVLEENRDGTFTVVEGHSRIFALRTMDEKKVRAVVVRGVEVDTPDSPGQWSEVVISDQKQPVKRADLARRIDSDTHRGIWSLP